MNKKLIPVALASLLVVAAGCGRSDNNDDTTAGAPAPAPAAGAAAPTTAAPDAVGRESARRGDRCRARRERPRSAPRQHRGTHAVRLHQRREGAVVLLQHVRRAMAACHRRRELDGRPGARRRDLRHHGAAGRLPSAGCRQVAAVHVRRRRRPRRRHRPGLRRRLVCRRRRRQTDQRRRPGGRSRDDGRVDGARRPVRRRL